MYTSSQTTYILLEKGVEDIQLYNELNKLIFELRIASVKELITRYPKLYELKQGLAKELEEQENIS